MNFTFSPATPSDVHELIPNLRPADARELEVFGTKVADLPAAVRDSTEAYAVRTEAGDLVCLFGIIGCEYKVGVPWMLGTPILDRYAKSLCRYALVYVEEWMERSVLLHNLTHAENTKVLRWLKWLGFDTREEFHMNGHRFIHFKRYR